MATSKFIIFQSGNVGAPQLYGTTGSLLNVLDYCLITGSGWIKEFPNTSSITGSGFVLGCYKQPTGSGCTLFINDGKPHGAAGYKEAWATGWESLTGFFSSSSIYGPTSGTVGVGNGQFPYVGQLLTTNINGHVTVVKSNTADTTVNRPWIMYVDSHSFYLFMSAGTVAAVYESLFFGDIYSYKPTEQGPDLWKCTIQGRMSDNVPAVVTYNQNDVQVTLRATAFTAIAYGSSGFIQRNVSGRSPSIWFGKQGDFGKSTTTVGSGVEYYPLVGVLPLPTLNNTMYISPVFVFEPVGGFRGEMRGMYQICHPLTSFNDGQIFSGSNQYSNQIFQVVKRGPNSGMWAFDITNNVQTN